jgi:tetratricopeptide (TPR) repeat protein
MRIFKLVPCLLIGLFLGISSVNAEQIRLADGRYLQGDVVEVKEDGFVFKLIETGGQVFLRWNQVDAGLKKRLNNERDPDEGLNLEVMVDGARLELIDGTVLMGDITRVADGYRVRNSDLANGKVFSDEDVIEDGYIPDIKIPAIVMMEEPAVLALAEAEREPLETARQYYELARIADRLALYEQAKDFVTLALSAGPDSKLQARLSEYETELDELIRQAAVLKLLVEARKAAKKKVFHGALNILDEAKAVYKPTGPVLNKVDDTYKEIDLEFTSWVIDEWYGQLRTVARDWLRQKENKDVAVTAALNWARRSMEQDVIAKLADLAGGGDAQDIKKRFLSRFDLEKAGLKTLRMKKASFGEDGFYQIVGGNRLISGRKPQEDTSAPDNGRPGRGEGRPGRDRDGFDDPREHGFQDGEGIPLPDGMSKDDIKDIIRRALGEDDKKDETSNRPAKAVRPDLEKVGEPPRTYPSLMDWWDKASTTTKAKWLVAVYVTNGGTMVVYEWPDWNVKYK